MPNITVSMVGTFVRDALQWRTHLYVQVRPGLRIDASSFDELWIKLGAIRDQDDLDQGRLHGREREDVAKKSRENEAAIEHARGVEPYAREEMAEAEVVAENILLNSGTDNEDAVAQIKISYLDGNLDGIVLDIGETSLQANSAKDLQARQLLPEVPRPLGR